MKSFQESSELALRVANTVFPECRWKNHLRAGLLKWRMALPRELLVRRGDVVVQVGMWRHRNVGRLAKCVGAHGRIVLIEADQRNVDSLKEALPGNCLRRIDVVCKGAWSAAGKLPFQLSRNPSHNRIDMSDVKMVSEDAGVFVADSEIEVDTVDNILDACSVQDIDYAEISVNGAELPVLQGMVRTLPHTKRIFVAGYARTTKGDEPTNVRIEAILREAGFRTMITRKTRTALAEQASGSTFGGAAKAQWGDLDGHVFGWRE